MARGIRVARRTPIAEAEDGFDGEDGDPHAPIGIHYEHDSSGGSGGLREYSGCNVYGI